MTRPILRSIAVVIALSLGCVGAAAAQASPPPPGETPSLPDIVAPLLGAVVNISVLKPANAAAEGTGASAQIGRTQHSLGSGFIIDPAGYIATNRHVVADGYTVTVTLDDDRQFPAKVLATNLYPDLALLKIEAGAPLPTVRFGDSNALRLGETVIAIGNPLGLSGSISVGVVSALNRNLHSTVIDDFIQTDASINHGNSGGPLFNLRGQVVGMNWALVSDTAGSIGLGLAIPANADYQDRGSQCLETLGHVIHQPSERSQSTPRQRSQRGSCVPAPHCCPSQARPPRRTQAVSHTPTYRRNRSAPRNSPGRWPRGHGAGRAPRTQVASGATIMSRVKLLLDAIPPASAPPGGRPSRTCRSTGETATCLSSRRTASPDRDAGWS